MTSQSCCGKATDTTLKHLLWCGKTGYSFVAMKMDTRSPPGFKAGRTRNPRMPRGNKVRMGDEGHMLILRARKQWFIDLVSSEMESADLKTKLLQKPRSEAG